MKWTSFLFAKRQFLAQTLKLSTQTSRDTLCTGNEASIESVFLLVVLYIGQEVRLVGSRFEANTRMYRYLDS